MEKAKRQLPCINCITLPVCKAITNKIICDYNDGYYLSSSLSHEIVRKLASRCSLIKNFCKITDLLIIYWNHEIIEAIDYLTRGLTLEQRKYR